MGTHVAAKLLLASSFALSTIVIAVPSPVKAEIETEIKLGTSTQAIGQANRLNLIPIGARASALLEGDQWVISFKSDKMDTFGHPYLMGEVALYAANGKAAHYWANLESDFVGEYGDDSIINEAKWNYSAEQAQAIAKQFIEEQDWQFSVSWMFNPYPLPEYDTRFSVPRMHDVRFNRSHNGIREVADGVRVTVDRVTGEVRSYNVVWNDRTFAPYSINGADSEMLSLDEAAKRFYDTVEPFLEWQDFAETNQPKLVYSIFTSYLMTADGIIPQNYQWTNPPFEEKIKPAYPSESAKKRLLAMFDLNLHYADGELFYVLRLKPEITYFRDDMLPAVDANSGGWVDFLNQPIEKPFPPPGEWLIDLTTPAGKVGYDSAVVWDNELLKLQNEPFIQNGFTLVPFRELLNKLNAKIEWDPDTRKVTASKDGTTLELTVDSDTVYINGQARKLESPARLREDGRTYIPARLVLETFGAKVGWDPGSRLVLVSTEDDIKAPTAIELKQHRFQALLNWEEKKL